MKNKVKNYFPGGNTPSGFYSFYQYLPYLANDIYIIKGGPGTGKSTFMKTIGNKAVEFDYEVELHWCSSDNNSLDGVVIPKKKIAFMDGTAPHIVDPKYPGAVDQILNFGKFWDKEELVKNKDDIIQLTDKITEHFQKTYQLFNKTEKIYELQKKYYQKLINEKDYVSLTKNLINSIFNNQNKKQKEGKERHLFGTALTPNGIINILPEINNFYENNYYIIGEPGSKSGKLLKLIGEKALAYGFQVTFLHSTFEVNRINGIIIPELQLSAINVNFSDETHYKQNQLQTIDLTRYYKKEKLYELKSEIKNIESILNKNIERTVMELKKAKDAHDQLEKFYIKNMNFKKLNQFTEKMISKIFNI